MPKATYNAPATVLDFACMSGGRLLLLLPGNHHLEVLTLTASECSKFTISPKIDCKGLNDLKEACKVLQVDFGKQQYGLAEGGEVVQNEVAPSEKAYN